MELEVCGAVPSPLRKKRAAINCTTIGTYLRGVAHYSARALLVARHSPPSFVKRTALLRALRCLTLERDFAVFYAHQRGNFSLFSARTEHQQAPLMRQCPRRILLRATQAIIRFERNLRSRNFDSSGFVRAFAKLATEKGHAPFLSQTVHFASCASLRSL